eukprot:TRINITY_DN11555_c5_g1_i1.p1 TRINITY_DN11555_c5_g1~~TRINITY_DN11555_c5_g1_i1.p1  ORF type:complete len:327 (+),score=40.70 TRINITY_DN11555_c5_g1_i1:1-981(+)
MATIVEFDRLHELDDGIWCCRSHFSLGENQNEGLQWQGLKDRLLSLLPKGLESSELQDASESNQAELKEEAAKLTSLLADKYEPFPLDTTMIIARTGNGKDVAIFSPVPYTEELNRTVSDLGPVKALVCPNLQHWLFIPQWAQAHPDATIYLAPPALGEDLAVKLSKHASACVPQPQDEWVVLQEDGHQLGPDIDQQLLLGAPLNMNEVLFYHRPSRTLIAADGFYSGYRLEEQPTWFARLWFKVTKGSFRAVKLPVYRTSRVSTHGDVAALRLCVDMLVQRWQFDRIVAAHGSQPFTGHNHESAREAFKRCWYEIPLDGHPQVEV